VVIAASGFSENENLTHLTVEVGAARTFLIVASEIAATAHRPHLTRPAVVADASILSSVATPSASTLALTRHPPTLQKYMQLRTIHILS
jgi:hypothetical protein